MPIIDDSPVEPFYLKVTRLERENMKLVLDLGEKEIETARLREALQAIAVLAGDPVGIVDELSRIRCLALAALKRSGNQA